MKVVIASGALGNSAARSCLNSLLETAPVDDFDLCVVRERGFRERTLNAALQLVGTENDVLFVGDDIEFTPGWYEALMANYDTADILGFSMLYPASEKVQDRGYDLMRVDERITLEAKDRGLDRGEIAPFGIRVCDGLCGCLMFVKAEVFELVPRFRENGRNRWGEFIFACEARRGGATVAVVDHFLYHGGKSTKSNPEQAYSSTSYQVERPVWDEIVRLYVNPADVRFRLNSRLEDEFKARLEDASRRVLFYGIGTVTEFILRYVEPAGERVAFCTGLPEEVGLEVYGQKVRSVEEVPLQEFDWVLITPLDAGERLFRQVVRPLLPEGFEGEVSVVEVRVEDMDRVYRCRSVWP